MTTFQGIKSIGREPTAIFRIPTATHGDVFMAVRRTNFRNDERFIVEVDATRFLALWRKPNSSHLDVARGNPKTWLSDRKFGDAERGFSHGATNPVPMALVSASSHTYELQGWMESMLIRLAGQSGRKRVDDRLGFIDGVTRTIWLLAAGATSFPVECCADSAKVLHRIAGVGVTKVSTVADLVPTADEYYGEQSRADAAVS